jgi:glycosyltransferase involved in cell wall biosynthesis
MMEPQDWSRRAQPSPPAGDEAAAAGVRDGPAAARAGDPAAAPARRLPAAIAFVITTTDFGGTEEFLDQLVARLDPRRFAPVVFSLCPPGRVARQLAARGVAVETLGMSARARPRELLAGARRLARQLDERRVELVHSFLYRGNVVARGGARGPGRGAPAVWGQHSLIATSEGWLTAMAARWTRPLADRVVAVADAVRDALITIDHVTPERIAVIGNGVDSARFRPADGGLARRALGLAPEAVVVGTVGRLVPEKGQCHLLEAVALGRRRGLPLELVVAGEGPERAALTALAERLGIAGQVHLLGFQRNLQDLYPAFDLFALPSLEEASPIALLEAMACGLPAVVTPVGGVPAIVDRGECGLIVATASAGELARAIARLATEPALRRLLGKEARRRVEREYDLAVTVRRHEELYDAMLGTQREATGAR